MHIPAHNTINHVQFLECPLWPAVEHEPGICPNYAIHQGTANSYLKCVPKLRSLEDSRSHLLGGCRHRDIVKSYIGRHIEGGRLIFKAITESRSGSDVFIADLGTKQNMQAMGALSTRLPSWLAQGTTISRMLQEGEERDRINDSLQ